MPTIQKANGIENRNEVYRCEECVKKFCGFFKKTSNEDN